MAGGNGQGDRLNQLSHPCGLFVDKDKTIYIADRYNHRIVRWKCGDTEGQIVAGGNGHGNKNDQLGLPTDMIVDSESDSLIICDAENRRVVRWPRRGGKNGETIISDIDCFGVTMDSGGFLYISDDIKNEVRRWKIGETSGTLVAGGNRKGDHLNQFNRPTYLFVDRDQTLYVSDHINRRIMKWKADAKEGSTIGDGKHLGKEISQLSYPRGLIVDQMGTVYVSDVDNHRIMCWVKEMKQGSVVIDRNGRGTQSDQLNCPNGLSFDPQGNLYVVDSNNNRVLKFDIDRECHH